MRLALGTPIGLAAALMAVPASAQDVGSVVLDTVVLTAGLRLDHGDSFDSALSPSLNVTYRIDDAWSMKLGVARAFKTPNLYQLSPNYVYQPTATAARSPITSRVRAISSATRILSRNAA